MSLVERSIKHATVWDTKVLGRPNMLELVLYNYRQFDAEVVLVT